MQAPASGIVNGKRICDKYFRRKSETWNFECVQAASFEARRFEPGAQREDPTVLEDPTQGRVAAFGRRVPQLHLLECRRFPGFHCAATAQEHRST